jgi:hypothetical protein
MDAHIMAMLIQTNRRVNRGIWEGKKKGSNGKDKDKSTCKGGQEIYHMSLVRGKGAVFAPERA